MLTHEENELLCRVGARTPMGRMLRRYWMPALQSAALEAGGAPRRVRLLGDDLVAFRAADGSVGLLDEHCPHRGASLVLAQNVDCALQCLYHGWKIAPSGRILETPAEPAASTLRHKVRARSYATYETGGLVWAYLGLPGTEPPRLDLACVTAPVERLDIMQAREECNWVQCLEGVIDSAHSNYLHANGIKPVAGDASRMRSGDLLIDRPSDDGRPRVEAENTAYGFRYAAIRRPLVDPEHLQYVRATLFVAPFYALFPAPLGLQSLQAFVPIDDEHTMFYFFQMSEREPFTDEARSRRHFRSGMQPGIDLDAGFRKIRSRENDWLQDRESMRRGTSFSGVHGVNNEDIAVQESMGPIYDRTKERLGTSDVAVIRMRRLMLDAVQRFERDKAPPLGLAEPVAYPELRAIEQIIPLGARWQDLFEAQPA